MTQLLLFPYVLEDNPYVTRMYHPDCRYIPIYEDIVRYMGPLFAAYIYVQSYEQQNYLVPTI